MSARSRLVSLAVMVTVASSSVACSKDKEVAATLAELQTFTSALVSSVKSAPTPQAGVAAGQEYLESHREPLRGKLVGLKEVRGFQVSDETKKRLETELVQHMTEVAGLQIEYATVSMSDPSFRQSLEKLVTDYKDLLVG